MGSGWQSHIKLGNNKVDSIYPIQRYIVPLNNQTLCEGEVQHIPSLDKWMIYSKDQGIVSFKSYTISNGSSIKLPIKTKYVSYYNSHYSYIEGLFD